MADSTEGDTNVLYLGLLVPALIALIFGLVIHSFIIGVNVNDWWKGRSVTPVDHIATYLGISRMCAQCANTINLFVVRQYLHNLDSYVTLVIIDAVYVFFSYANIWLISLLSIVFCMKISNLNFRMFLYVRTVIIQRTVYFIVASLFFSAFSASIHLFLTFSKETKGGIYNGTMDNLILSCMDMHSIYNNTIVDSIPLLFCNFSSVLLFTSLYHHTTKMKMSSNLTINLETYYSAMRFISFTFIYNTVFFISHFACNLYSYFYCADLELLYIVLDILTVLHSSYLIYRTAKLRNQMSKILQNGIYFLFQKKLERK